MSSANGHPRGEGTLDLGFAEGSRGRFEHDLTVTLDARAAARDRSASFRAALGGVPGQWSVTSSNTTRARSANPRCCEPLLSRSRHGDGRGLRRSQGGRRAEPALAVSPAAAAAEDTPDHHAGHEVGGRLDCRRDRPGQGVAEPMVVAFDAHDDQRPWESAEGSAERRGLPETDRVGAPRRAADRAPSAALRLSSWMAPGSAAPKVRVDQHGGLGVRPRVE